MKKDPSYRAVHIVKIPKEVHKRLLFHRDTDLVLLESGDVLVLLKKADVEGILRASDKVLGDLWENSEDDVWNDV